MNKQDPNWDFISTAEDDYVYQQPSPVENSPLPQPKLWPQTKTCSTLLHATEAEDCSDIFKHLSNVQLHSHTESEPAETTSTTSTHQTWRRGESSRTKRKCNEMELPQSTQSKGNDEEARKKRNRDDLPPKKTRSASTRNISERRRRDKINGKIRTLQELIPNCRKSGRASVLDDAIEYIKVLQRQVQTITMGGGAPYQALYMPTAGYQGLQLPHFSPYVSMRPMMGMGMGIDIGFGLEMCRMPCSSVLPCSIQVPSPILNPSMSTVADLPGLYGSGALPMPQVQQLKLNSSQLFPAQSSTSIAPSIYVTRCTTQGESSSRTIADENNHMPNQVENELKADR